MEVRRIRVLAIVVAMVVVMAGCSGSEVADSPPATATPVVAATPRPTAVPTATPEPTPVPTPTPDPILAQAEAVALEYRALRTALLDSPRGFDLTRMLELVSPEGTRNVDPLALAQGLLRNNYYLDASSVVWELVGSRYETDETVLVDVCVQTGGIWRDLDTDEVSLNSHPDPALLTYTVSVATMLLVDLTENLEPDVCALEGPP